MIELGSKLMPEYTCKYKLRCTAIQAFQVNALGGRQNDPVRNLESAGVMQKFVQQHIQIHLSDRVHDTVIIPAWVKRCKDTC